MLQIQFLFDDGDQYINCDGDPDLRLYGVFGKPVKLFDTQVLLDPFEEQFDLPAAFVKLRDCCCRELKIVGKEHQTNVFFGIVVTDAAKFFRVIFAGVKVDQPDRLVALNPLGFVCGPRVNSIIFEVALGARNKEGGG